VKPETRGIPFAPHTRLYYLATVRRFIDGLVEAEQLPARMLASSRLLRPRKALRAQAKADPKDIDPVVFAKLLGAALQLRPEDVPDHYPFELWMALAAVWLWSAIRKDEVRRLRTDCVRDVDAWRSPGGERPPICLLEIPRNKTGASYAKPVPIEVGDAIRAWLAIRPPGQYAVDRKSGRPVEMLFMLRGKMIGAALINKVLIPLLCRRAGVPSSDSRGPITSHRARATVASALHNADHPMGLFELKEYLGHVDVRSTEHYVRQSPQRLAERYAKAMDAIGRVDVLVDRDAVVSGAAARGEAWIYHAVPSGGLCSNDAYAACPHRMACEPKCSFHVPQDGERARLLAASQEVRRYVAQLDLDAEEAAAVTPQGLRRLRRRLRDVPVPEGLTPRELRAREK
jgi:integrase